LTPTGGEVEAVDGEAVDAAVFEELNNRLLSMGFCGECEAGGQVTKLRKRREGRGRREGRCRACWGDEARVLGKHRRECPVAENNIIIQLAKNQLM
jgi:hypothetical protein